MTRRRRAAILLGLALLLGGLAASDVSGREAALRRSVGPVVPVVVARTAVPAGARLDGRLAIRRVPSRYAPVTGYASLAALAGARALVAIPAGQDVVPAVVDDGSAPVGAPVRSGERVAEIVARGAAALVRAGGHVDVLVTRETADGAGSTVLALEDAEVLAARPAAEDGGGTAAGRVALSLRVTVRQAVYLAAAQAFARELRVLPRAAGDRAHGLAGTRVGASVL